ncbi:hypothetical protein CYMTET_28813, partial [Cymbomonas tetramitiformis]
AASSGSVLWAVSFGAHVPMDDSEFEFFSHVYRTGNPIALDTDGSVIICGAYHAGEAEFAEVVLPAPSHESGSNAFVAKVNSRGSLEWAHAFRGTGTVVAESLAVADTDSMYGKDFVISGSFDGTASFGEADVASRGDSDAFVLKMSAAGTVLWSTAFGGNAFDGSSSIASDGYGNYFAVGRYMEAATFGEVVLGSEGGSSEAFLAKVSATGTVDWAASYGRGYASSVAVDTSFNTYIAGNTYIFDGDEIEGVAYLVKVNNLGTTMWRREYGASGANTFFRGVAADPDGHVAYVGSFSGIPVFEESSTSSSGTALFSEGKYDGYLGMVTTDGEYEWLKQFGSPENDWATAVAIDSDGSLIAVGSMGNGGTTFGDEVVNTSAPVSGFMVHVTNYYTVTTAGSPTAAPTISPYTTNAPIASAYGSSVTFACTVAVSYATASTSSFLDAYKAQIALDADVDVDAVEVYSVSLGSRRRSLLQSSSSVISTGVLFTSSSAGLTYATSGATSVTVAYNGETYSGNFASKNVVVNHSPPPPPPPRAANIWQAAGSNNLGAIQDYLNLGTSIDAVSQTGDAFDSVGTTALVEAAGAGHVEAVKFLLSRGANINKRAQNKNTALHVAARRSHQAVVKALIEAGARKESRNKENETPLHLAVGYASDIDVVELLLNNGARVNQRNNNKKTPLDIIKTTAKGRRIAKLLEQYGGRKGSEV